jgi:hypothetical protein
MTRKDLQGKTKEELIDIVERIYSSPYLGIYFSIQNQLDKLAKEIEYAPITIEERTFDSFLKWGEKSLVIADNLQAIIAKIDSDTLTAEKDKRLKAKTGSPESFRRNKDGED